MSDAPAGGGVDRGNVESVFPLTPMQSAMLFATLRAAGTGSDPGFLHLQCTLAGSLDEDALEEAWRRVMQRHAALRTSVHWQQLDRPLQVVFRSVETQWAAHDWSAAPAHELDKHMAAWLDADRARGLDLTRAPVLRLARFRTGARECRLVCSCHHVLLDGWSGGLVIEELVAIHNALRQGSESHLPEARPFRDYAAWLQARDFAEAEAYWRAALDGLVEPTPLPFARPAQSARGPLPALGEVTDALAPSEAAALHAFARQYRLTPGTVLQGAWALLLGHYAECQDVCFGATVSGRSVPVPGIELMAGLLTNVLPVRARLEPDRGVVAFLSGLQEQHAAARRYEYVAPTMIQDWSQVAGSQRVFDSLVVLQRPPASRAPEDGSGLVLRQLSGGMTTTYPLTLVAAQGEPLRLRLIHDRGRIDGEDAQQLLQSLRLLLQRMLSAPAADLRQLTAAEARSRPARAASRAVPPAAADADVRAYKLKGEPDFRAPRDRLELQLAQIWEDVLRVHPVGVDDDFFSLGGHSLTAAQVFDRIERVLGRRLPLATLFEAPSIARLAERLRDGGWTPPWSSLVAMQTGGRSLPVYCFHSFEGNILFYRELARRLAADHPVYGLQSVGLDGGVPPLTRVEDMAAHYLREMRDVQPSGPYVLIGRCFGIAVAFELAMQLRAAGEEVGRVLILDSAWTQRIRPADTPRPSAAGHVLRRVRALGARSRRLMEELVEPAPQQHARELLRTNQRAWARYDPPRYAGTVTLIRSAEYGARQRWHDETWEDLAGQVESHVVPGDHHQILREPWVAAVADVVRACLRDTQVPV